MFCGRKTDSGMLPIITHFRQNSAYPVKYKIVNELDLINKTDMDKGVCIVPGD
jgi:hypothetical protein